MSAKFFYRRLPMHYSSFFNTKLYGSIPTGTSVEGRGVKCRWGIRKTAISTIISLRRVLSTARPSCVTDTVPSDRGKLVTLVGGVCVQHSSETRVTVLLWPFVADDLLLGDR